MNNGIRIIGIGSPLVDSLLHVSEEFLTNVPGEKGGMELVEIEHIEDLISQDRHKLINATGGSAANTIVGLSKLGVSCTFLGKLGKDEHADFYIEGFTSAGVNIDRFKYCPQSSTGRCLSMITPDSERTCRTHLGAAMSLSPDEISVEDFDGCTHAHIEGYKLFNRDLAYKLLSQAKEAGCIISLDLASFEVVRANQDILNEILDEYVSIVFANEDEAMAYSNSKDPLDGLNQLSERCEVAAVKLGAEGAYIKKGNETVKVDTEAVKAVDTTGAGDLWASGFLFGYCKGLSLESCGKLGSILGASVVQHTGAMIPEDQWPELEKQVLQFNL